MVPLLIPFIIGFLLTAILILVNINRFKKRGFLYYLPKEKRLKPLKFWKPIKESEGIKIIEQENPERFNKQIKKTITVSLIYAFFAVLLIIVFVLTF